MSVVEAQALEILSDDPPSVALVMTLAIRCQRFEIVKAAVSQIATRFSDSDARWIFRRVAQDIPPELTEWFKDAIAAIRMGDDG